MNNRIRVTILFSTLTFKGKPLVTLSHTTFEKLKHRVHFLLFQWQQRFSVGEMVQTTNLELAINMFRRYPEELIHYMVVLLSWSLLQSSIVLPLVLMEKSILGDLEGVVALDILNLTFTGMNCCLFSDMVT